MPVVSVSRPHLFPCPHCQKVVDKEVVWSLFLSLAGRDEYGFYVDFGGDRRYFNIDSDE